MHDRRDFIKALPKHGIGAEIGVWKGDFSRQALDGCEPRKLYLIDPWEKNDDATNYKSTVARSQDEIDEIYEGVRKRFAGDERVAVVRMTSEAAALQLADVVFDWVYIDGIHSYEAVAADMRAWAPLIRDDGGGRLCGHDYNVRDVRRAVREYARSHNETISPFDRNWMITINSERSN